MKKLSAPGRRASTKRMAFKGDEDLVEEISYDGSREGATAGKGDVSSSKEEALQEQARSDSERLAAEQARADADRAAAIQQEREAAALEQQRIAAEAKRKAEIARQEEEDRRQAEENSRQARLAEERRLQEAAAAREREAALLRQQLEEEEDRKFKEEEARREAEEEAELERLKVQVAEKERQRKQTLEAMEAERLRVLRAMEEEAEADNLKAAAAARALALAQEKEREEERVRIQTEREAIEREKEASLQKEREMKAAKEAEWKRLMEEEEALQLREEAEAARRKEQERIEQERREQQLREEAEAARRKEQERIEQERLEHQLREEAEAARRKEQERYERQRQEEEAAEAERLRLQRMQEEEAMAAAAAAEAELQRKQAELEERRLATLAKEEAEAAEQKRKLEEIRRKRQSFLNDTDVFSSTLETQYQEKDDKLKAVKERETNLLSDEIQATSKNFTAPAPSKLVVAEEETKCIPQMLSAPDIPKPEPEIHIEPTPVVNHPSQKQSQTFTALTSSLFGDEKKESLFSDTPAGSAPIAATSPVKEGVFFEASTEGLFKDRTFAVKTKKSSAAAVSAASPSSPASAAASRQTEPEVDWDAIESEGKVDSLTGDMQNMWKARQMDLTTRRLEFRGAVCYGLGGIFSWQMYSAAESRDEVGKPYTEYLMRCQWGTKWENMQPWLVARRYREFDFLDSSIRKEFPELSDKLIPLPGKALFSFGQASIPERTKGIEEYMINILTTVPQVLRSNHMYIFLDLAERIEVIRKKIKDMEANEGITTPSNLPAPGTNKELNNNNPAPIAAPSGARTGRAAPSSSSGQVGFGPGGLNATLVSDRRESKRDNHTTDEDEIVSPLEISELYDETKAESMREQLNCRMLDDDSLGILEENIRDLVQIAQKTRPAEVQKNKKLIRSVRLCQSQWPALRATCNAVGTTTSSMLIPRAMQAEEDLDRVLKEIKSVLIAQSMGSPLHF